MSTDLEGTDKTNAWSAPNIDGDSLALLQYTSGSTGRPKGVMVSHANLLSNQEAMCAAFGHDETSALVGWLPVTHDMGLVGNVLQPLYSGATAILMPPMAFVDRPIRWLQAISKYQARTSGGPNFSYELCLQKISAADRRMLDLSSWTVAFNGSEPVRASTIERFAATYSECGFQREAFQPCYGLAEGTLLVSTPSRGKGPKARIFDKRALSLGIAVADCQWAEPAEGLVSCGFARNGHAVKIVDPQSLLPCPEGTVGEIWFGGPSVAKGYWRKKEDTDRIFNAYIARDPDQRFVRTGDLGFVVEGELFIAGRIKDLIILRGRNYYPTDLEQILDEKVAGLRPTCNAAFLAPPSGSGEAEEHLVLVTEVERDYLRANGQAALFQAIRAAIAGASDIGIGEIVLAPPGAVPKTTSGKVRRNACREAYLNGSLLVLARSGKVGDDPCPSVSDDEHVCIGDNAVIDQLLRRHVARILRCSEAQLPADFALQELGLNSLQLIELKHAIDIELGVDLPLGLLLADRSRSSLIAEIAPLVVSTGSNPSVVESSEPASLSFQQQAMWTVHQLESDSIAYNLHVALDISGPIDTNRLQVA